MPTEVVTAWGEPRWDCSEDKQHRYRVHWDRRYKPMYVSLAVEVSNDLCGTFWRRVPSYRRPDIVKEAMAQRRAKARRRARRRKRTN